MTMPEEVPELIGQLTPYMTLVCEVFLADWQDNPNSGAWVKLKLPDETHLEPFRGKSRAGRTQKWGQRYHLMLVEIGDDEKPMRAPMDEKKPMKLSQLSGAVCHDKQFWEWLSVAYEYPCSSQEDAAGFIRSTCGVESRSMLDSNPEAAEVFRALLKDFDTWKQAQA